MRQRVSKQTRESLRKEGVGIEDVEGKQMEEDNAKTQKKKEGWGIRSGIKEKRERKKRKKRQRM